MHIKYVFRPGVCVVDFQTGDTGVPMAHIAGPCIQCGKTIKVVVAGQDLADYRAGDYADTCFPYLSADAREFLISGICGECWDKLFGGEEDYPEEDE